MTQRTWKPLKPKEAAKMARKLKGWRVEHKREGGEVKFISPAGHCFAVGHNAGYIPIDLSRALHAQTKAAFPVKKGRA